MLFRSSRPSMFPDANPRRTLTVEGKQNSLFTRNQSLSVLLHLPKKYNRLENPNWREVDQLAIYKYDRGFKLGSTEKKTFSLVVRAGSELATTGFQVPRPNYSAKVPPSAGSKHKGDFHHFLLESVSR